MTRFGTLLVTLFTAEAFAGAFAAIAWLEPHPRLLWNASASAPTGLYHLQNVVHPAVGELVAIRPPVAIARFMARRGYLPEGVPLLKQVAAVPGQQLCRHGARVTIDGRQAAIALTHDRAGRPLPVWDGCRVVPANALFFINTARDSFDSRYVGPLPASGRVGRALPIFTRDAPGAPLTWCGLRAAPSISSASKEPSPCR